MRWSQFFFLRTDTNAITIYIDDHCECDKIYRESKYIWLYWLNKNHTAYHDSMRKYNCTIQTKS